TRFSRDWSSDVCSSDLSHAPRLALAVLAGIPALGRRQLAPNLAQKARDLAHQTIRGLVQHALLVLTPDEIAEVDGLADKNGDAAARREEPELAIARHELLFPPVRNGDQRDVAGERQAHGTRLAAHGPHVGVTRQGALRVDDDAAGVLDDVVRLCHRLRGA